VAVHEFLGLTLNRLTDHVLASCNVLDDGLTIWTRSVDGHTLYPEVGDVLGQTSLQQKVNAFNATLAVSTEVLTSRCQPVMQAFPAKLGLALADWTLDLVDLVALIFNEEG
jgi:hypothetical protein